VATLFVSGFIPGLIIAFGLMVVVYIIAKKKKYPRREERLPLREIIIRGFRALPALFMPVVILGGVFAGVVSVTEASAVAVGYAFFYGLVKQPRTFLKEIWSAVSRAVNVSVMILTVVGCAGIIIWVLATDMSAQQLADSFLKFSRNPYIFLLFINILYLILGCLLETGASIFLTIPLLFPIATKLGINPVHFNLIVTINLCIGFITPPVGLCLYVLCGITKLPLERVARSVVPFLLVEVAVLFLVTYVPDICLVLPKLVGMIK
jgi:tripartite ATP-independent transporter DctM subunit